MVENNLITIITPTGFRPEAFKLCQNYIQRQTYRGPIQWIVVHDEGTEDLELTLPNPNIQIEVHKGPTVWQEGLNTQRLNMNLALSKVKGKFIFVMEDDEWYSSRYLEIYCSLLEKFGAVGESNSKYFHVQVQGYKEMGNVSHSSLSQTAFRVELLELMKMAVNSGNMYFDIVFWLTLQRDKIPTVLMNNKNLSIGIKGMPGRGGIGAGHRTKDYIIDLDWKRLESWVGPIDSTLYKQYSTLKRKKPNVTQVQETRPQAAAKIQAQRKI